MKTKDYRACTVQREAETVDGGHAQFGAGFANDMMDNSPHRL